MKALYFNPMDCESCWFYIRGETNAGRCAACKLQNIDIVEVLELGVGFLGDKAIIRMHDGELRVVKISSLNMKGEKQYGKR